MSKTEPTAWTIEKLEAEGWECSNVEYRTARNRSTDLFGFIDILAFRGEEVLAVQTTDHTHVSHRVKKIADAKLLPVVRKLNWSIQVHGWRPDRTCRVVDVS